MVVLLTTGSLEGQHLAKSFFNTGLLGAAGTGSGEDLPSNRTSFLSHFEGSNNGVNNVFDDSSASNHTVTANANITQGSFSPFSRSDGKWGVSFDGVNDSYLTTPNSSDFAFGTGDFTVEFWFNPNHDDTGYILDSRGSGVNGFRLYRTGSSGGDLVFSTAGGGNSSTTVDVNTVNNNWYHFCATRASGVIKFFLNGSQVGSDVNDTSNITSTDLNIGAGYTGTLAYTGIISNIRIIKGTAVNPTGLPTSPATNVTNTVLLTCQSNRFVDNSSSGHTITPDGGVAVTAFGPFLTNSVYDPAVNGASMQGFATTAGDSVQIAQTTDTDLTGDFTVECWVYFNGLGASSGLIAKWASTTYGWLLYVQDPTSSDGFSFTIRNDGSSSGIATITSGVTATTGQWYHVAACRTGTTVSMFVNGVRHATGTTSNNGTISSITSIGNYYSSTNARYVEGYICDARIINGTAAYDGATYTIPTAPLTAVTNTKLLLNMADGQAIDSTAQDNIKLEAGAKLSTAQYKFGTSSILFDAEADNRASFKTIPFGTGDFTVEGFFRKVAEKGDNDGIWDTRGSGQSGAGYPVLIDDTTPGQTREIYYYNGSTQFRCGSASALSLNTWYHIAVCRSGTSLRIFLDGTQVGSTFSDSTDYINDHFSLGNFGANFSLARGWDGYVDEFRISYMARYTSNFTAPTEPFADKGQ